MDDCSTDFTVKNIQYCNPNLFVRSKYDVPSFFFFDKLKIAACAMVFSAGDEAAAQEKLKELKEQNTKRWEKLKALHAAANGGEEEEAAEELPSKSSIDLDKDAANPRAFLREVVETHDELVQIKAILEQRLHHDRRKVDEMKFLLHQNRELKAGLEDKIEAGRPDGYEQESAAVTRQEHVKESTFVTRKAKLEQEHAWLLEELSYVANLMHADDDSELWSLETFLLELLKSLWDDEYGWLHTASDNPIHPKHLELLQEYHVIESDKNDPDYVRLTDYLEE